MQHTLRRDTRVKGSKQVSFFPGCLQSLLLRSVFAHARARVKPINIFPPPPTPRHCMKTYPSLLSYCRGLSSENPQPPPPPHSPTSCSARPTRPATHSCSGRLHAITWLPWSHLPSQARTRECYQRPAPGWLVGATAPAPTAKRYVSSSPPPG